MFKLLRHQKIRLESAIYNFYHLPKSSFSNRMLSNTDESSRTPLKTKLTELKFVNTAAKTLPIDENPDNEQREV